MFNIKKWTDTFVSVIDQDKYTEACVEFVVDSKDAFYFEVIDDIMLQENFISTTPTYQLAEWLVWNYFRLLYDNTNSCDDNWYSSHNIRSIGGGNKWPDLTIYANNDEQTVKVVCKSYTDSQNIIKYVNHFEKDISKKKFSENIFKFIYEVKNRLETFDMYNTDFHCIIKELESEINNEEECNYRIIEAKLGYNPDDAPDKEVKLYN